jgi:hypothetical protein
MKKHLLFLFVGFAVFGQEKPSKPHYEFRTNLLTMLSQSNFNASIEKKNATNYSFGISMGTTQSSSLESKFKDGNTAYLAQWDVTPFVRYKLSTSNRSFYFAEAFGSINQGKYKEITRTPATTSSFYQITTGSYTDFALGGSLGYSLLVKSNWTVEFLVGFGSNLVNTQHSPAVVSRVGLSLGYQF